MSQSIINQSVRELKALTNTYIAMSNAERELAILKIEHKNSPLSPHALQQRVASIGRKLGEELETQKMNFIEGSEKQRLAEAMVNSLHSYQRYAVNNIPTEQTANTTTITASMGMSL